MTPRGVPIHKPRDRGAEILADPDGYFRRARAEAKAVVDRDLARERRQHPTGDPMTTANKATLAAALAALTSIVTDLRGADSSLTVMDWVITVLAGLIAGIGVWLVPNYAPGRRKVQGGHSALYVLWCIVLALAAVVLLTWLL